MDSAFAKNLVGANKPYFLLFHLIKASLEMNCLLFKSNLGW